ncbi:MAG: RNA polymerase factor sigma-54 [Pseudomonadota bacterium]
MALSPKLVLRQSQTLAITPQLMQAIKLLQLSTLELNAYIETELGKNPLLEREETTEQASDSALSNDPDDSTASDRLETGDWAESELEVSAEAIADKFDAPADSLFPEDLDQSLPISRTGGSDAESDPRAFLENLAETGQSLHDHLANQLGEYVDGQTDRLVGMTVIDEIDENGYFKGSLDDIAERLAVPQSHVEQILKLVQSFDPVGVGARSLEECLTIQLMEQGRFDPAMQALVENLELAAKREFNRLVSICGVDKEDLADMLVELRALDPKPGRGFQGAPITLVVPDILVREEPGGFWGVELNQETVPRLIVNRAYYARIDRTSLTVEEKTYLSEKLQSANWLIKSLDQRARTMIKVGKEIVRQQDGFFVHGVEHLKPLTLKQIADAIDMHESTVSRVTSNKYIATPRGTFEMKFFFTSAIAASDGGDAHAAEAVRQKIKRLIDAEKPDAILSDDQIVRSLMEDGIDIARRTVAKYREAMRIPSSVQRRREKKALISV